MRATKVLFTMVMAVVLMSYAPIQVKADTPNIGWWEDNTTKYWYEAGIRQGTYDDPKGVLGDGTVRGREIYDPESDGWYWLDAVYDGAKAVNKEVWMPYIYQNEADWSMEEIAANASASGDMAQQVINEINARNGKWVRYDADGKMYKGWYTVKGAEEAIYPNQTGNTYYYDPKTGLMAKGSVQIEGVTYYFDEITGVLQNSDNTSEEETQESHTHNYVNTSEWYYPTCTQEGYSVLGCECGDTKREILPITEHGYGSWEITRVSTCSVPGINTRKCDGCGKVLETQEIPVIAHNYGFDSRVSPTCTEKGSETYKCVDCGDSYSVETSANGHITGSSEITVEATHEKEGVRVWKCAECGEILETEIIPAWDLMVDSVYYVTLKDGTQEAVVGHYDREAAAEMLELINRYRVENGVGELIIHEGFQEAADKRGYETAHTWDHKRPNGGSASVAYGYSAENLATVPAYGDFDFVELVFEAWKNSEGHNGNILSNYKGDGNGNGYTGISCFCKKTNYGYLYYWVQVFH